MMQVESFSQGKTQGKNEDFFGYNQNCFVIADGATDKSGRQYNGKTGGELVSKLVVKECLSTKLNGKSLVNHLNNKIKELYHQLNLLKDIKDPKFRFTCVFICARVLRNEIIITYMADLGFRINEKKIHQKENRININHAQERAKYIKKTGDIPGGRNHILPLLEKQFRYQNNSRSPLGYGALDGTKTPLRFIKTFKFNRTGIKKIELFTDGYFSIPPKATIKGWEELHRKVEKEDPDKWKKYLSTKPKDDRTIAIIIF